MFSYFVPFWNVSQIFVSSWNTETRNDSNVFLKLVWNESSKVEMYFFFRLELEYYFLRLDMLFCEKKNWNEFAFYLTEVRFMVIPGKYTKSIHLNLCKTRHSNYLYITWLVQSLSNCPWIQMLCLWLRIWVSNTSIGFDSRIHSKKKVWVPVKL